MLVLDLGKNHILGAQMWCLKLSVSNQDNRIIFQAFGLLAEVLTEESSLLQGHNSLA